MVQPFKVTVTRTEAVTVSLYAVGPEQAALLAKEIAGMGTDISTFTEWEVEDSHQVTEEELA